MARDIRVRYIIDSTLSEIGKRKNFKKSYSKKIKQMRHVNQLCSPFFLFLAVEIKKGQHKSLDSFFFPVVQFCSIIQIEEEEGKKS
jgi:hypothetical protein